MSLADIQAMKALKLTKQRANFTNGDGYNTLNGLRKWRNAIADIDNNPVKIMIIGDSVSYGSYASDLTKTNWVGRMRTSLQSKLGDCGFGWIPIPSGLTPDQSQWTNTGSWSISSGTNNGLSTRFMSATGISNTTTFSFTGTSVDIVYATAIAGGTATITIDGVTQASINCNASTNNNFGNIKSYTGLSTGNHTVVITAPATGSVYLEGAIAHNPPATSPKGVYIYNLGMPGVPSGNFLTWCNKSNQVLTPHLTIIAHGLNDAATTTNTNNYLYNMGQLISNCQSNGSSVLLVAYYPTNSSAQPLVNTNYPLLIKQMYQLADQYNCALVDVSLGWEPTYALAQADGLMGSGLFNGLTGSDPEHPSDKGHRYIASIVTKHLIGTIA